MSLGALNPSLLGTLQDTLTPAGVLTMLQAAQDQESRAATERTQQAAAAASQAGKAYSTAAAAPMPDVDPLTQLIQQTGGDIGSVISRNPAYRKNAQDSLDQAHADLLTARVQNLQALRDAFDVKAKAAETIGNSEVALNSRMKSEQLAKTLDVILAKQREDAQARLETQREGAAMDRVKALIGGRQQAATAATAAKAPQAGYFPDLVHDTPTVSGMPGIKWIDYSKAPDPKSKAAALEYAHANGAVPVDAAGADRLRAAGEVYAGLDNVEKVLSRIAPKQMGPGSLRGAAGNVVKDFLRSDADVKAFRNTYPLAIRSIQALAAGSGSGFRLNQSEINTMKANWPKITDPFPIVQAKLAWERVFLKNKERSLAGLPALDLPEPTKPLPQGYQTGGTVQYAPADPGSFDTYRK